MAAAAQHNGSDDFEDLRARAVDVATSPSVRRGQLSAAEAAHCLTGVMSWIQRTSSAARMQEICAELARFDDAWTTSFGKVPLGVDGRVDANMALLATVCRGVLELAGGMNLRAALAFWATESDPAEWRKLFA